MIHLHVLAATVLVQSVLGGKLADVVAHAAEVPLTHGVLHLKLSFMALRHELEQQRDLPLWREGRAHGCLVSPEIALQDVDGSRQV